jgi:LPXTG-site transpeptidase (sortase) family protein
MTATAPPVTVIEPQLSLHKDAQPTVVLPDEPITFTLTVAHTAQSQTPAYDVVLTDILPTTLHYVQASLAALDGPTPTSMAYDANSHTVTVKWNTFPLGQTAHIAFKVTLSASPGDTVQNTASVQWTSLPGDVSTPQSGYNTLSTERRYDPVSPADVYGASSSADVRMALPNTGFAPGRVTALPEQKAAYDPLDGILLEIPKLGLKLPIVGVPRTRSGWDLTWLWNNAGWLEGTAFPTWAGNTAITAHVYLSTGEPGPFVNLHTLHWGDQVVIHANGKRYIYEVRAIKQVKPNDASVLGHKQRDWVTLITCEGYDEASNTYRWRLAVQAVLMKVEPEP